ncbi:MAG: hypothetical protein ACYC27_09985 [Armatimonadota bacterium]
MTHSSIGKYTLLMLILLTLIPLSVCAEPSDTFMVGPNTGWDTPLQVPVDLAWDAKTRRLHTRSLYLTEVGDAVDLRIRRVPGQYPDGPLWGNQSTAGEIPGGIHWDALTGDGVWRQAAGIEGVLGDQTGPAPTPNSHPGWLTFYTYSRRHDDRLRRVIIDDTGAMSLGGGGFGSEGLPTPAYGLHLFGGGMRVNSVPSPEEPRLSVVGEKGTAKYTYQIVARDSKGNQTMPGKASVIDGPAELSGDNYIRLQWDRCPGAETYWVIRNGQRLDIEFQGEGNAKTFEDKGLPVVAYTPVTHNTTADVEIDGTAIVKQAMYTPGVCTPQQVSGIMNDYNPPGLSEAATLALNPSAPMKITGIQAPISEGRWLVVLNVGKSTVTLVNKSDQSKSANTIITGTGKDLVLKPDQMIQVFYTLGHWRLMSPVQ